MTSPIITGATAGFDPGELPICEQLLGIDQFDEIAEIKSTALAAVDTIHALYAALNGMDRLLRFREGNRKALPAMVEAALAKARGEQ